jgi:hypothetical protein
MFQRTLLPPFSGWFTLISYHIATWHHNTEDHDWIYAFSYVAPNFSFYCGGASCVLFSAVHCSSKAHIIDNIWSWYYSFLLCVCNNWVELSITLFVPVLVTSDANKKGVNILHKQNSLFTHEWSTVTKTVRVVKIYDMGADKHQYQIY